FLAAMTASQGTYCFPVVVQPWNDAATLRDWTTIPNAPLSREVFSSGLLSPVPSLGSPSAVFTPSTVLSWPDVHGIMLRRSLTRPFACGPFRNARHGQRQHGDDQQHRPRLATPSPGCDVGLPDARLLPPDDGVPSAQ